MWDQSTAVAEGVWTTEDHVSTFNRPKTRGVQSVQGRITSSLFAEKDKDAEPRHIRICLHGGKIWVTCREIRRLRLFHGLRNCFEGPRRCFGLIESHAGTLRRCFGLIESPAEGLRSCFWPFRELCRGAEVLFWPSRELCRGPVDRFPLPEDLFPHPEDLFPHSGD